MVPNLNILKANANANHDLHQFHHHHLLVGRCLNRHSERLETHRTHRERRRRRRRKAATLESHTCEGGKLEFFRNFFFFFFFFFFFCFSC